MVTRRADLEPAGKTDMTCANLALASTNYALSCIPFHKTRSGSKLGRSAGCCMLYLICSESSRHFMPGTRQLSSRSGGCCWLSCCRPIDNSLSQPVLVLRCLGARDLCLYPAASSMDCRVVLLLEDGESPLTPREQTLEEIRLTAGLTKA